MSTHREPVSVLLVDDSREFREGLRGVLEVEQDMAVVAEAGTGEQAMALAAQLQPDVVLMDLQMPGCNGIEATRRIVAASPHIGILVLTMHEDDESVFTALRAGARGYLLKGAPRAEILRAIAAVAAGQAIFSPAIARRMMKFFAVQQPAALAFPELTDREREVLSLIAQGHANVEIAERLSVSLKTVQNHVSNICNKLQLADRTQAVIRARDAGLR